jgi:hypothetical protein
MKHQRNAVGRGSKNIGQTCDQEYNAHMCSRECFSVSRGGLVAGLLIMLAAFVIGVTAVRSVIAIFLSDAEITHLHQSVGQITVQSHTPEQDLRPLEVHYHCSFTHEQQTTVVFTVSNVGSEAIHFDNNSKGKFAAFLFDATGTSNRHAPARVSTETLAPDESGTIFASMPLGSKVYEFSVDYSTGNGHLPRTAFGSAGAAYQECKGADLRQ